MSKEPSFLPQATTPQSNLSPKDGTSTDPRDVPLPTTRQAPVSVDAHIIMLLTPKTLLHLNTVGSIEQSLWRTCDVLQGLLRDWRSSSCQTVGGRGSDSGS